MRGNSGTITTVTSTQPNLTRPDVTLTHVLYSSLAIALQITVVCAILGYRTYRVTVMQQRIQRLNRLWQLDSSQKSS